MFDKILIANRGEIACRIIKTARRMGVATVAVYSEADAGARHVRMADEAIFIGPSPARESYLVIDKIIDAAKRTGAQAIHPGYGFLSENEAFCHACDEAGVVFIGPPVGAIRAMGSKSEAKKLMEAAKVPLTPGYHGDDQDAALLKSKADAIGYPVMIKAAAGGGGKGMRAISSFEGIAGEIESAMREAQNAFGDAGLIAEKLVQRGRHIEVQIVGDGTGNVVHLFERECSLQRRHQKLVEEAPAANLPGKLRERILEDAVRLGRRLNYRGVGTVEFIVSGSDHYFLEVNPRLQVEHPVTEMVTGLDIVEIMIRIAAGAELRLVQHDIACQGHAIEARICAEDPDSNFMPCTGEIAYAHFPTRGVRIETGIESGSIVTPYYDSMLAKLIVRDETRDQALDRLSQALNDTSIFGVTTNQAFLSRLLALPATRTATFHTRLIDEEIDAIQERAAGLDRDALAIGACFWMMRQRQPESGNPWRSSAMTGWHMATEDDGLSPIPILRLESAATCADIRFAPVRPDGSMLIGVNDAIVAVKLSLLGDDRYLAAVGARCETVRIAQKDKTIFVHDPRCAHMLRAAPYLGYISAAAELSGELRAPMTGVLLKVNVAVGHRLKAGDTAAVMESMKMELRLVSKIDGVVTAVHRGPGDTVERNAVVVVLAPE